MKDIIKTHSGDATKKPPSWKDYQKARQIVDNRSPRAVTGACLTGIKQVCGLLVLLVDSKLKNFVAINTQPCLCNCNEVEMKAKH